MMILMSLVHFSSFCLLRRTASIIRCEGRQNSIFQELPETVHTPCFIMILMSRPFCKFQPDTTVKEFSLLSVTRELHFSKLAMKT